MNEGIDLQRGDFRGELADGGLAGDIAGFDTPGFGGAETLRGGGAVGEADDGVPGGMQQICRTLADEAAACDEEGHSGLRCF